MIGQANGDDGMLSRVRALLELGKVSQALELLQGRADRTPALNNAYGVCLLRCGKVQAAVEVFRGLVLERDGISLKRHIPAMMKTNFATALLMSGNVSGALDVLVAVNPAAHPHVLRLRAAIAAWKRSLPLVQRLGFSLYGRNPGKPVDLDFRPGDVGHPGPSRFAA